MEQMHLPHNLKYLEYIRTCLSMKFNMRSLSHLSEGRRTEMREIRTDDQGIVRKIWKLLRNYLRTEEGILKI